jgi:5-formyltetrahydrofolate cyclo-ligase
MEYRNSMDQEERNRYSCSVVKLLASMKWILDADRVLLYHASGAELDVMGLAPILWDRGKEVYLPKVVGKHLLCLRYSPDTRLTPGTYGILEPDHRDALISEDIDAVLVPGLAFSRTGLRLGRGGGYFDRFLVSTAAKRIGVCFSCQIAPWLPADEWDMGMDAVVCPDEIIYTGRQERSFNDEPHMV